MSVAYKIDKRRQFVLSPVSGEVTSAEMLAHQRDLSADRDVDPTCAHIADFTYGTMAKISPEELRQFAQRSIFSPEARRAFIVPNLADYGLGRMCETLRDLAGQKSSRAFARLKKLWTGLWRRGLRPRPGSTDGAPAVFANALDLLAGKAVPSRPAALSFL